MENFITIKLYFIQIID